MNNEYVTTKIDTLVVCPRVHNMMIKLVAQSVILSVYTDMLKIPHSSYGSLVKPNKREKLLNHDSGETVRYKD